LEAQLPWNFRLPKHVLNFPEYCLPCAQTMLQQAKAHSSEGPAPIVQISSLK
jgi:hypothetical protein